MMEIATDGIPCGRGNCDRHFRGSGAAMAWPLLRAGGRTLETLTFNRFNAMPTPTWKYADNTFEVSTRNSWTLMNKLATDHLAKLTAKLGPANAQDADIAVCHGRVTTAMETFTKAWSAWQNLDATYGGRTDVLEALIGELSSKSIRQWDIAIQNAFMDDTPEYAELLPGGRGPFQTGAIEDRVQAVKTLGERLGKFAQFAAVQAAVTAFHASLKTARDNQKGRQGERDTASTDAEQARVALAAAMYANVGRLMEKHSSEPHRIEDYFDLSLIRQTPASPAAAGKPSVKPAADATPGASGKESASSSGEVTTVTELAPRTNGNGNGIREHAPV